MLCNRSFIENVKQLKWFIFKYFCNISLISKTPYILIILKKHPFNLSDFTFTTTVCLTSLWIENIFYLRFDGAKITLKY